LSRISRDRGGTVTGFTQFEFTIAGKWLETLKQIAPRVTTVAIVMGPGNPLNSRYVHQIKAAAKAFGVQLIEIAASDAAEIERAIAHLRASPMAV
jgi:putative ABC transport system substrate-binding protein